MAGIVLNNLPFDEADLADPMRHIALGRFMTAWSQVEVVWSFLFRKFLDLSPQIALVVSDKVKINTQLAIVRELIEYLPQEDDRSALGTAISTLEKIASKRNKIVHSSWGLLNGEAARYDHALSSDKMEEVMNETPKGNSIRANHIFTIRDLEEITSATVSLRDNLENALHTIRPEPGPWGREQAERQAQRDERRRILAQEIDRHRNGNHPI